MGSKQQIATSPELQKTAREKQNKRSALKIASSLTQSAAGEQPRASYWESNKTSLQSHIALPLGFRPCGLLPHSRDKANWVKTSRSAESGGAGTSQLFICALVWNSHPPSFTGDLWAEGFSSSSTPDSSFSVFKAIHSLTSLKSCWCLRLQGSSLELDPIKQSLFLLDHSR